MDKRCLTYPNLAKYIQEDEKLDFLHDIVPKKITVKEYKKILAEEKVTSIDGSDSEDSTSEEESEENEGSSEEEEEDKDEK